MWQSDKLWFCGGVKFWITYVMMYHHAHVPLRWRHNEHDIVSNHQPHDCLLNRLFRRRSKKTSKLRVTGLCAGNSPGTGEFSAQMASHAENVSIWWRHHALWSLRIFNEIHVQTFWLYIFKIMIICMIETQRQCISMYVRISKYHFDAISRQHHVHPCEKVIGIFFQNQIWSRLFYFNRLCLICI